MIKIQDEYKEEYQSLYDTYISYYNAYIDSKNKTNQFLFLMLGARTNLKYFIKKHKMGECVQQR